MSAAARRLAGTLRGAREPSQGRHRLGGGSKAAIKRRRSTTLDQWQSLLAVPGARFVNLQYGDCTAELAAAAARGDHIEHWSDVDPLHDLEGFAAQVAELDLVISVDNATVHMAGALGVPVWILLHAAPNCAGSPDVTIPAGIARCRSCGRRPSVNGQRLCDLRRTIRYRRHVASSKTGRGAR